MQKIDKKLIGIHNGTLNKATPTGKKITKHPKILNFILFYKK